MKSIGFGLGLEKSRVYITEYNSGWLFVSFRKLKV